VGLSNQIINFDFLLFSKVKNYMEPQSSYQLFKDNFVLMLYLFCIVENRYYHPLNKQINESILRINKEGTKDNLLTLVTEFFKNCDQWPPNKNFNRIKDFVVNIDETINFNQDHIWELSSRNSYSFKLSESVTEFIKSIFSMWRHPEFVFYFRWHGLSAGEAALLNLFSRIHSISRYDQYNDNIWILIDEGDLYLHPEWQRTFLNNLHVYLPKFFKDKRIQLFLTSHSPFLVSDLPTENLILMTKDENGWGIVVDNKRLGSTFGANIHTLFTDAFFLKNGLIGEFARSKIESLIQRLNQKDQYTYEEYTILKKEIDIIGEPFIRFKLLEKILKGLPPEKFDAVLMEKEREVELLKRIQR
jgi:hypothetical protein